ncbi:RNB-like protein [Opisthorchis viverrini]|uniref:RNB-like protein n=2 Tax=Opisthorchis viverrini TaxID=6198 RepID=A0A1S8WMC9_OPIVI|nr:RNB-like protein [Opisthorchis viverrini]
MTHQASIHTRGRSVVETPFLRHVNTPLQGSTELPRSRAHRFSRNTLLRYKLPQEQMPDAQVPDTFRYSKKANPVYSPHWSQADILAGLEDKSLLSGTLRINPKHFDDAYIKHPSGDADVFFSGLRARNRALPNDIVAVQIEPKKFWKVFDTFVKDSVPSSSREETKQRKRQSYVTLSEFLASQRHDFEQLVGVEVAKEIAEDLNSCSDPPPPAVPSEDCVVNHAPWWSVIQRTGKVVGIINRLHSRACIGYLTLPKSTGTPKKDKSAPAVTEVVTATPTSVPPKDVANTSANCWSNARLTQTDTRLPYLLIPRQVCPQAFISDPSSFKHVRYVARITSWPESSLFPTGELLRSLSPDSTKLVEAETDRILVVAGFYSGLDSIHRFPDSVEESAKEAVCRANSAFLAELRWRTDFRPLCVFTIDPSTARDLDDALHIRSLSDKEIDELDQDGCPGATYEVGVHIADVSYFVRPNSPVDMEAARRATTIYLVQLCVPMLPRILCEELCSLNVGEDKRTFSVVFKVDKYGNILRSSFGRSVIRSCAKLSYENAQLLIDNPDEDIKPDFASMIEPPHSLASTTQKLSIMLVDAQRVSHACRAALAMQRRQRRFSGGSLRLDQIKTAFVLDDDKQIPLGVAPAISKPSNWLVEEWMLAANESVAERLAKELPETAFLRRHAPPSLNQLSKAADSLKSVGINVNTETAGSIQASICHEAGCAIDTGYHYSAELVSMCADMAAGLSLVETDLIEKLEDFEITPTVGQDKKSFQERKAELEQEARMLVAVSLLTKTMNLAEYFCLGELPKECTTEHYALNMEFYTHFTSPIRRYADVIVHRQLAAILAREARGDGNAELADWYAQTVCTPGLSSKQLQTQAEVCNSKKLCARRAGEESAELFYVLFVKSAALRLYPSSILVTANTNVDREALTSASGADAMGNFPASPESGPLTEVCAVTSVLSRSFDVMLLSCGLTRRVYLQHLDLRSSSVISARRVGNRTEEGAKLCLLWNYEANATDTPSTAQPNSAQSVDITIGAGVAGPTCGCFYTEIKLLDVVLCRISVEDAEEDTEDIDKKGESGSGSLPTLRCFFFLLYSHTRALLLQRLFFGFVINLDRPLFNCFINQITRGQLRAISPLIAYVEHPVSKKRVFIMKPNHNMAVNGDIVVVRILPINATSSPPAVVSSFEEDTDNIVPDSTVSMDENLESEFVELPLPSKPASETNVRKHDCPSRYCHFFYLKTFGELTSKDSALPPGIPEDMKPTDQKTITSLPRTSRLIPVGQVLSVAKRNPRRRRLLGQISFFRPSSGRITRDTVPLEQDAPVDDAICLFIPNSGSHPSVKIVPGGIPEVVLRNRALGLSPNYVCEITGWNKRLNLPYGVISEQLGGMDELELATKQILIEYGLEDKDFLPEHLEGLPKDPEDFRIPSTEYLKRRDFRSCCVLSIDPASAKDIDDALHVRPIDNDLFEVGVHIADVSYFVKPGTALDREAADRTTSVYLVQRVIPMLPAILSSHLCSLQPGADRLAFSVVMKIRTSGEIVDVWFGRTIIRSRTKLSYDEALALMETVDLDSSSEKVKQLYKVIPKPEAPFKLEDVRDALTNLNKIARNLRKQRLQQGALTLQKAKIEFDLPSSTFDPGPFDPTYPSNSTETSSTLDRTRWPRGYSVRSPGPSHQLIEEWMLAANQAVARRLFQAFVQHFSSCSKPTVIDQFGQDVWPGALLRRHEEPSKKNLKELQALYDHSRKLIEAGHSEEERTAIMDALSHLVYVRMKMATYFSLDDLTLTNPELLQSLPTNVDQLFEHTWHYGLCVPLYTHFTSPIRRYADLLVHRQLSAILHESEHQRDPVSQVGRIRKSRRLSESGRTNQPLSQLALQAQWCNIRRMLSRRAQEASQRLFLTACLRDCGPLLMDGTVLDFNASSIKVLLSEFGIIVSCPLKKFLRQVNWQLITDPQSSKGADSNSDRDSHNTRTQISTQWTVNQKHHSGNHAQTTEQEPTPDNHRLINLLSVLPCRVYCQKEKLVLLAEFEPPNIDNAKSATSDPDQSATSD